MIQLAKAYFYNAWKRFYIYLKAMPNTKSILIIEDQTNIRELYTIYLSKLGITIYSSEDGKAAFELAKEKKPDLIITDLFLPSITGFDLIYMFREDSDFMSTPIIVISASSQKDHITECIKLGATDYMVKPASITKLEQKVKKLLNL